MSLSSLRSMVMFGLSNISLLLILQHKASLAPGVPMAILALLAAGWMTKVPSHPERFSLSALLGLCALMTWPILGMGALVAHTEEAKLHTVSLLTVLAGLSPIKTVILAYALAWFQSRGLDHLVGWSRSDASHPSARA